MGKPHFETNFLKDLNICIGQFIFQLLRALVNYVSNSISILGDFHMHIISGFSVNK